jgi:hypothetical protein
MHASDKFGAKAVSRFVEKRAGVALFLFSAAYVVLMHRLALRKPLWIDEYLTLYLARLDPSEISKALLTGAESHPLPFLLLTGSSLRLFGSSPFALRLPAIVGFLIMELCIFQFVARRCSRAIAFTALLVPFATRGISYAMEARGYGLLLGMTALSLVCWQAADEGHRRRFAGLLAATLAAATACHYFGALIVLPLALGELVRWRVSGRVNRSIWAAFTASAIPLIFYVPFIRASRGYARHHGLLNAEFDYFSWLLVNADAILLSLLLAIVIHRAIRPAGVANPAPSKTAFTPAEIAVILGYTLLPIAAFIATRVAGLPFANRYVLSAVIGVSVIVAIALSCMADRVAIAITMATGLAMVAAGNYVMRTTATGPSAEADDEFVATHASPGLPVVASDIETFFRLGSSGRASVADRVLYLTNTEAALHYLGNNTSDRILNDLRPWLPLRVESFCGYLSSISEFQVYGPLDNRNWVLRALAENSMKSRIAGVNGERLLISVRLDHARSHVCEALR